MAISFERRTRLLFVGDSITDCGRLNTPDGLGSGYVRILDDYLTARDPVTAPKVLNAGVSGDRVIELRGRWARDVIEARPDVVSVCVGVNDVWSGLHGGDGAVPADEFFLTYRDLLDRTRDALPGCQFVLCEPSGIWPPAHERGSELLRPYVEAVYRLAGSFSGGTVVPLHSAFFLASRARPDLRWTDDGVHPTPLGHMLIARTWLETTQNL